MRKSSKYFAIRSVRQTGVFHCHWDDVRPLVHRYPKVFFTSFPNEAKTIAFLNHNDVVQQSTITSTSSSSADDTGVVISPDTLIIYTDGCCIGNTNVKMTVHPAGWGFVVVSKGDGVSDEDAILMEERYGPIVLESSSLDYLGAKVTSNNVAELTAIGEAFKYLLNKYVPPSEFPHVVIRYDSEYATKSILGIWNGKDSTCSIEVYLIHTQAEKT